MLLGICGHIPPSALLLPTVLFAKHSSSGRAGAGVRHRKLGTTQGAPTRKDPRPHPVHPRFRRLPIPETQSPKLPAGRHALSLHSRLQKQQTSCMIASTPFWPWPTVVSPAQKDFLITFHRPPTWSSLSCSNNPLIS